jgi:formylglycine-generating enzyme required for sulfatase activity
MALALAFLAAPMATYAADEMRIESFDATGRITFTRMATGQSYRVECATSLTGAWTRVTNAVTVDGIPTTMDCIPAKAGGLVTGAVPVQASAMFFRTVAETNEMAFIPAGEYAMGQPNNTNMGSEVYQHTVYVSAFHMERHEVTSNLWREVFDWATTHGYVFANDWTAPGSNYAVGAVTWSDAAIWCNARSEREGFTPCYLNPDATVFKGPDNGSKPALRRNVNGYRLPTEAEWEKAARGGAPGHTYPWTDVETLDTNRYSAISSQSRCTVGFFAPNGYGLYDMAGSVKEWCWDWAAPYYYATSPRVDPMGPDSPITVGAYYYALIFRDGIYTCAFRKYDRDNSDPGRGFRCVRSYLSTGSNHPPAIVEGASTNMTMSEDSSPMPFDLTLHATDADGDSIGWWVLTPPSHGSATVRGQGTSMPIVYQPAANYYGGDSFAVQAYDPWGATTSILVNVTIQAVNDPPAANAQVVSVATNTPRAITLTGSDVEGSGLTYAVVAPPTHGSLSGAEPNVTYTPFLDYKGPDSFTFVANDGTTDGVPATVTLWVNSMAAAGGSLTNYTANGTNYTAHIFTTVGNSTLAVSAGGAVEVLVVAGGGGGGGGDSTAGGGGGGGAGGLIYTNVTLVAGPHAITVGTGGGAGSWLSDSATPGGNSALDTLTASGGGCAKLRNAGLGGGSGSGGYGNGSSGGLGNQPGGYANSGGMGGANPGGGGGGGGAGSAGGAGVTNSVGGNGGAGLSYDLSGILTGYAGGGGGGAQAGSGGTATDGGGQGETRGGVSGGVAGAPNTGGGGGGGAYFTFGGAGGSGIVIVRYGIKMP